MYYNIELINEKTKETILYEDVQDLNEGEKMYFNFQINAQELQDGEYKLNVIDGDGNVVASDTLNVGEFDIVGIQHKRGENVYINTVLNAKTEANDVEIRSLNSTIYPSGDADAMTSVFVRARPVYNDGFEEGYSNGIEDGKVLGIAEQKNKLTNITITENGTYQKEDGYHEITVNVPDLNGSYDDGYADGIEEQKSKLTNITITENGTYSTPDGYSEVNVNVQDTNGSYADGYADGIANAETAIAENAQVLDITANGKYVTKYSGGAGNLIKEVNVSVMAKSAIDFSSIGYDYEDSDEVNARFNADVAYSKTLYDAWNPSNTIAYNLYQNDTNLVYCPKIDTSNVTNMSYMFSGCSSLTTIPKLNTSSVNDMNSLFKGCSSLTTIPLLKTNKVTDMGYMFDSCSSLTSIPQLDTSSVQSMFQMFYQCSTLTTIPQLDTRSVTQMYGMFQNCSSLKTIPKLNTSNVTNMNSMFNSCKSLTSIPLLDTSNVTSMSRMFYGCTPLTTIPQLNTSKVTDISYMFNSCSSLTTIPQLDTSSVTQMSNMFYGCTKLESLPLLDCSRVRSIGSFFGADITTLTDLGGFKGLQVNWNDTYGLAKLPNLTYQSIMNVINNLYDFRGNGDTTTTRTLKIHSNAMAMLTDADKAIAVNKGWTLTS